MLVRVRIAALARRTSASVATIVSSTRSTGSTTVSGGPASSGVRNQVTASSDAISMAARASASPRTMDV